MKLKKLYESTINEVIRKIGKSTWRIYSHKGKNLGTYKSFQKAKKRLGQIEAFKHMK
jgi:hypothetical protein